MRWFQLVAAVVALARAKPAACPDYEVDILFGIDTSVNNAAFYEAYANRLPQFLRKLQQENASMKLRFGGVAINDKPAGICGEEPTEPFQGEHFCYRTDVKLSANVETVAQWISNLKPETKDSTPAQDYFGAVVGSSTAWEATGYHSPGTKDFAKNYRKLFILIAPTPPHVAFDRFRPSQGVEDSIPCKGFSPQMQEQYDCKHHGYHLAVDVDHATHRLGLEVAVFGPEHVVSSNNFRIPTTLRRYSVTPGNIEQNIEDAVRRFVCVGTLDESVEYPTPSVLETTDQEADEFTTAASPARQKMVLGAYVAM